MKASLSTLPPRYTVKVNDVEGILNYDVDNLYPQRMYDIVNASGTTSACVSLYAKYIEGNGFADKTFWKSIVNSNGLTLDKLLRATAQDYSRYRGFAIHMNYNALYEIEEYNWVPWEFCRLAKPDDENYSAKIAVYDNWDKSKGKKIEKDKIDFIHVFNPKPEVIQAQIEEAGGIEKYKGQILWYSADGKRYPLAPYAAVIEDVLTDAGIKTFRYRNITTNFMASHMLVYKSTFESDEEREEFRASLSQFQGTEAANKIMLVDGVTEETKPELTKFDLANNDKLFEVTNRTTKDAIIERFGQPPILLGVQIAGKLGTADEIRDAEIFYDKFVGQERRIFEEEFTKIFKHYKNKINETGDYSIIPVSGLVTQEVKPPLITVIGVGGIQALSTILADPNLSAAQKINTLVLIFGMTKDEATSLVLGTELN